MLQQIERNEYHRVAREHPREHHQEFPGTVEESCLGNVATINPAFRRRISAGTSGCSLSRSITIVAEPHNLITAEVRRHPLSRGRLTSSAQTGESQSANRTRDTRSCLSTAITPIVGRIADTECRHVCIPLSHSIERKREEGEGRIERERENRTQKCILWLSSRDQLFQNTALPAQIPLVNVTVTLNQ